PSGGYSPEPVTAAVSGDRSDGAVLAAALDLAARCHAELRLLHARPLPQCHSDTPEERWAAHAVLESAPQPAIRSAPQRKVQSTSLWSMLRHRQPKKIPASACRCCGTVLTAAVASASLTRTISVPRNVTMTPLSPSCTASTACTPNRVAKTRS